MGVIIRGCEGKVLLTLWRSLWNVASVEAAEAEACMEGVRLTIQWIKQLLQVELDCKLLIQGIMQEEENRSQIAGVIAKIKGMPITAGMQLHASM
jgi:hypothetical protein